MLQDVKNVKQTNPINNLKEIISTLIKFQKVLGKLLVSPFDCQFEDDKQLKDFFLLQVESTILL